MKTRFHLCRIIISTVFVCIALLGITYAKWTNSQWIRTFVSTGSMNYDFNYETKGMTLVRGGVTSEPVNAELTFTSNKVLNIAIPNGEALMGLTCGKDILRIQYSLAESDGSLDNVPLKPIEQYLSDVSVNLDMGSIACEFMGGEISAVSVSNLIPSTLGTFQVYHSFDGINGTIDLIPIQIATIDATMLKAESIPEINSDEMLENSSLIIRGSYSFSIPLDFQQFNAE